MQLLVQDFRSRASLDRREDAVIWLPVRMKSVQPSAVFRPESIGSVDERKARWPGAPMLGVGIERRRGGTFLAPEWPGRSSLHACSSLWVPRQ